ncbi:MAG TPA: DUF554 domain-containing protein [Planctomycetota bacterium]|nr:DUF554 domain-containing protein [Planctomycetota bacterium]
MPLGVLINVASVAFGTLIGVLIGSRISERFRETATAVLGCVTAVLGIKMAIDSKSVLLMLMSLLLGAAIGEALNIDGALQRFGKWIEARVTKPSTGDAATNKASVAQAFVTASLIFIVGPITVLGSIQDGLYGDYNLIAIKALLDMIASMTLAVSLGWGVGLSVISIFVIQGGISLIAKFAGAGASGAITGATVLVGKTSLPLGDVMINEMAAAGGVLMIGTGLLLLDLKKIRIANLLPAIAIAPAAVLLLSWLRLNIAP